MVVSCGAATSQTQWLLEKTSLARRRHPATQENLSGQGTPRPTGNLDQKLSGVRSCATTALKELLRELP
jgi:hypothetical protein